MEGTMTEQDNNTIAIDCAKAARTQREFTRFLLRVVNIAPSTAAFLIRDENSDAFKDMALSRGALKPHEERQLQELGAALGIRKPLAILEHVNEKNSGTCPTPTASIEALFDQYAPTCNPVVLAAQLLNAKNISPSAASDAIQTEDIRVQLYDTKKQKSGRQVLSSENVPHYRDVFLMLGVPEKKVLAYFDTQGIPSAWYAPGKAVPPAADLMFSDPSCYKRGILGIVQVLRRLEGDVLDKRLPNNTTYGLLGMSKTSWDKLTNGEGLAPAVRANVLKYVGERYDFRASDRQILGLMLDHPAYSERTPPAWVKLCEERVPDQPRTDTQSP